MGCDSRPRARAKPLAGRNITHSRFKRAIFLGQSKIPLAYADHHSGPTDAERKAKKPTAALITARAGTVKGPFERFGTCRRGDRRSWNEQGAFVRLVVFLN
jgi:hypothetical protein